MNEPKTLTDDEKAEIHQVSRQFQTTGRFGSVVYCPGGHINKSFFVTWQLEDRDIRHFHQRINTNVFHDPEALMNNIAMITSHLSRKLLAQGETERAWRVLTVIPTRAGALFWRAPNGDVWRTYAAIDNATNHPYASSPSIAFEAGKAFGKFQELLLDFPSGTLAESIPGFLNTRKRFDDFLTAIQNDGSNRARLVRPEIEWVRKREHLSDVLSTAITANEIPLRVSHNDAKLDNVLFERESESALAIVDLDTVMDGSPLYDCGDMIRTMTSTSAEDDLCLNNVQMRMPLFEALFRGYLSCARSFLSERELSLIIVSGKMIAFIIGVRFLTDFLNGDRYFHVSRPEHNLERCRTQFRLVQSIEEQEVQMEKCLRQIWNETL